MFRNTAVSRVKLILGFRTDQDDNIIQAMKEAQEQYENDIELPDFLRLTYDSPFVTPADGYPLDVPDDFIREWEQDQLNITDAEGTVRNLVKDELGYLRIRYPGTGVPVKYALVDRQFYFFPLPDAEYTLHGTYYAKDASLNGNIENKWLEHLPELIWSTAGILVASALRDQNAIPIFVAIQQQAKAKLANITTANDAAGSKPVIGGED